MLFGAEERFFGDDFETMVKRVGSESGPMVVYFVLRDLVSGDEIAHEVTYPKTQRPLEPLSLSELQERKAVRQ